jgi:hypothetical protein
MVSTWIDMIWVFFTKRKLTRESVGRWPQLPEVEGDEAETEQNEPDEQQVRAGSDVGQRGREIGAEAAKQHDRAQRRDFTTTMAIRHAVLPMVI